MAQAILYSFTLRYTPEVLHTVHVPLDLLTGQELDVENVRAVVEENPKLLATLMGEKNEEYGSMAMSPHIYQKNLQRFDESIRLVQVTDDESGEDATNSALIDTSRVEEALRNFIPSHVDYDIHMQLENDEKGGTDNYHELALKFISLYNR